MELRVLLLIRICFLQPTTSCLSPSRGTVTTFHHALYHLCHDHERAAPKAQVLRSRVAVGAGTTLATRDHDPVLYLFYSLLDSVLSRCLAYLLNQEYRYLLEVSATATQSQKPS